MKKLIGILIAALMVVQSGAMVFAADYNQSVVVDGDLELKNSGDADFQTDVLTQEGIGGSIDYRATLYMENVRAAFSAYVDAAKLTGKWSEDALKNAAVKGTFNIAVKFDKDLTVPSSFVNGNGLSGFSDNAKAAFVETGARKSETDEAGNTVVNITIAVKDGITVQTLNDNLAEYLPDITLTLNGVTANAKGDLIATGNLSGAVNTTVDADALTVNFDSRQQGTESDEISAVVVVKDKAEFKITITADENVEGIVAVNAETGERIELTKDPETNTYTTSVSKGVYTIEIAPVVGKEVDLKESDTTVIVNTDVDAKAVTTDPTNVSGIVITKAPTKLDYVVGDSFDLTGVELDVTMSDGTTQHVVYSEETADDFAVKTDANGNMTIIYGNKVSEQKVNYTVDSADISLTEPKANVAPTTAVEIPAGSMYTAGSVVWSPSVADKFAYSTTYTGTVVLTAKEGSVFSADAAATVNGKSNGVNIKVSADGKTATVTASYKTANKGPGGGGGGGGGGGWTPATATPAPTASAQPGVPTPVPTASADQVFTDVPSSYWGYSYIMDLYKAGVVNGVTATTFLPENNINRAEFAKMAVVLFGLTTETTDSKFVDVTANDWFTPYVIAGTEAGIILGTSETTFSPYDDVTREQMSAIIGRYLKYTSETALTYTDAASIEPYALPYVTALTDKGLLQGDDTGAFRPQASATRAEAATLLDRVMVNELGGKPVGK